MTEERISPYNITIGELDSSKAAQLLGLLAYDTKFRSLLVSEDESERQAALGRLADEFGIDLGGRHLIKGEVGEPEFKLPSKRQISEVLAAINRPDPPGHFFC